MADKMEFPKTMRKFIDNYSFKDSEEVYTNGAELVPVFRVEQALEHYEKEIRNNSIDDFVKAIVDRGLSANDDKYCITNYDNYLKVIKEIAEQLKAGGENGKISV